MSHIGTRPPSGVKESCIALTEPFDAAVVAAAQSAEFAIPNRTSLPSMLPPDGSIGSDASAGLPACSCETQSHKSGRKMTNIAARRAQPCRVSPTILPNV